MMRKKFKTETETDTNEIIVFRNCKFNWFGCLHSAPFAVFAEHTNNQPLLNGVCVTLCEQWTI